MSLSIDGSRFERRGFLMTAARRIDIASGVPVSTEIVKLIGVASGLSPEAVIGLVHSTGLRHIVQQDGMRFDAECSIAERMIEQPSLFLRDPLGSILGPTIGTEQHNRFGMVFDAAEKKGQLLGSFGSFVAGLAGGRTIWDSALMIADEFFTNASKNAWGSASTGLFMGEPVHSGTIEFFAEANEELLVIGCRDTFGRLEVQNVVERIKACYDKGVADSIRYGNSGAGIGSFMVFDACMSYYAGVDRGQSTVVCVAIPLGLSRRAVAVLPKNIHLLNQANLKVVKVGQ
jgi:hypothetical protein